MTMAQRQPDDDGDAGNDRPTLGRLLDELAALARVYGLVWRLRSRAGLMVVDTNRFTPPQPQSISPDCSLDLHSSENSPLWLQEMRLDIAASGDSAVDVLEMTLARVRAILREHEKSEG